jgi:hypothetical protein
MTSIEDKVRSELKQLTGQVQPGQLRPLTVPRRRQLRLRRLLPAVAVATAVCAAVALLLTALPWRTADQPTSAAGMPRYYVTLSGLNPYLRVEVHDSVNGQVTGTTTIKTYPNPARAEWRVTAAQDDRTFIVSAQTTLSANPLHLYRVSVNAAGGIGPVADAGTFHVPTVISGSVGLSADGTMLALPLVYISKPGRKFFVHSGLEVINLMTRQVRTWTDRRDDGYSPDAPSWTAGDTIITFGWRHYSPGPRNTLVGLRQLDVTAPGTNLLSSRLVSFPQPVSLTSMFAGTSLWAMTITAGGWYIIGSSCRDTRDAGYAPGSLTASIVVLSAANGQLVRALRSQTMHYASGNQHNSLTDKCVRGVWSADPSGQHLFVQDFQFGRIDNGVFTALPGGFGTGANILGVAW